MTEKFTKLYISLKYRLAGAGMWRASRILEQAKEVHSGHRKDGVTPEFQHQLEIALYAFTLKWTGTQTDFESLIIVILLHDLFEDYPHQWGPFESQLTIDEKAAVWIMNKNRYSNIKEQFDEMSLSLFAALAKGMDRINNFQSMNRGNFKIEKQKSYALEVTELFLPMLKKGRKNFPSYIDAFFNIENMLKSQHELITLFIKSKDNAKENQTNCSL